MVFNVIYFWFYSQMVNTDNTDVIFQTRYLPLSFFAVRLFVSRVYFDYSDIVNGKHWFGVIVKTKKITRSGQKMKENNYGPPAIIFYSYSLVCPSNNGHFFFVSLSTGSCSCISEYNSIDFNTVIT